MNIEESEGRGDASLARPTPVRILVADDDEEMRKLMAFMLRRHGYQVIEFDDGTQLEHYLRGLVAGTIRKLPELIISDVRMPGYSGIELLGMLRASDLEIPAILVTGFGDAETHKRGTELGAIVLDKPFPFGRLRQEVVRIAPIWI